MGIEYLRYGNTTLGGGGGGLGPTGPTGAIGPTGPSGIGPTGGVALANTFATAYIAGPLFLFNGISKKYIAQSGTIRTILLNIDNSAIGADIKIRINKNGIEQVILTLPAQTSYIRISDLSISLNQDDYLTIDIIQVGNIFPGNNLTIQFSS